ncbi:MAG TPA: hypothetical protein VM802_01505 [Chitinophaga sp.]|uniref:hypothetical protein n=1 Tax=Chitinophaga sp. TaxID=1869181 RepID=UPI002BDD84A0|nr:hypothetical protein [Chitinophaga sp.]HVI43507.1 hypothetical protein [Chitinophaga sp.]
MKTKTIYAALVAVLALGACKKNVQETIDRPVVASIHILQDGSTLPNVIAERDTVILPEGGTFYLDGKTYVDSLGGLIINKGVKILGVKKSSPALASALVVTRGGYIDARGTATQPITFTSAETTKHSGDWGGVVVLGKSTVNKVNPAIEGIDLPSLPIGVNVGYGGNKPTDKSGYLQYIKILYAGASVTPNNELNGLTLGGVGSGTSIHHIFVYAGADDAFEFFGGTVNAQYLIAHSPNDDCFDFDFGYSGKIQFAVSLLKTDANTFNGDANGIESDNDGNASAATPLTNPVISNLTIIGGSTAVVPGTKNGNRWRRNTRLDIRNSIILGYGTTADPGIYFDPEVPETAFQHNLVHAFINLSNKTLNVNNGQYTTGGTSNDSTRLRRPFGTWTIDPVSGATTSFTFDARPVNTGAFPQLSPAREGADFTVPPYTSGFTVVAYRGAFSPTGTAAGWAQFAR